jgi:hypothetical protein
MPTTLPGPLFQGGRRKFPYIFGLPNLFLHTCTRFVNVKISQFPVCETNASSFIFSKRNVVWKNRHNTPKNRKFHSFLFSPNFSVGYDSSVSIAIRYVVDGLGIESWWGHPSRLLLWPTQYRIQCVPPLFPGSKTVGDWCRPHTPLRCRA